MLRRVFGRALPLAVAVLVAGPGVALLASAAPAAAAPCSSTSTIQITSLTANPPVVSPGQTTAVTLVAQNCTTQPLTASLIWSARFVNASSTGQPAGCPVVDPLAQGLNFPPGGQVTANISYVVFAGCTATDLQVTARITANGGTTAVQQTVDIPIRQPSHGCAVLYVTQAEWVGGFVANVRITNTGSTAITGWTLVFTFGGDQKVVNGWGATIVQSGETVTATNAPYDATINAGASVSVGLQGTWTTSDAPPTSFTLNGSLCANG